MNCLGNLDKCNASCCRQLGFTIPGLDKEIKRYYELHENIKVIGDNVVFFTKCKMLDKNNRCKIHFRGKPEVCKNGPSETNQEGYIITEGCLLEK